MAKDTEKLIRQLSLISYLMAERRPVSAAEIRRDVEGYSVMNEDAFARRFYADRTELDSLGIALKIERPADGLVEQETYALPRENFHLPPINFSDRELAALGTALALLDGEFAYAEPLRLALQQISWGLPSPLDSPEQRTVALGITGAAGGQEISQRLAKIETAIFRRKTITFDYYSIERDELGSRRVDPYQLIYQGGQFYLVGHSHERGAIRVFRLSRIRSKIGYATKSEHDFQRPADFDPRAYLHRVPWQFGAPAGNAEIWISRRISWQIERHFARYGEIRRADQAPPAGHQDNGAAMGQADEGAAKGQADDGARMGQADDGAGEGEGDIVFVTPYANARQLISWVLGLGENARVLGPPELAAELAERVSLARERHAGECEPALLAAAEPATAPVGEPASATGPAPAAEPGGTEADEPRSGESAIRPERFARLVTLAGILIEAGRAGRRLSVSELQQRLKVSEQELREDISVLNVVNFGAGTYVLYAEIGEDGMIDAEPEAYGDSFDRPARLLPIEAKALIAAIDFLGEHIPEGSLSSVREKVVSALGEDPAHEGLQFASPGTEDSEIAATVSRAIRERRRLSLEYYKESQDELAERTLEPYTLINSRDGWYVAGWDPTRGAVRHFRLDRVKSAAVSEERFAPRADVDPAAEVGGWPRTGELPGSRRALLLISPERARWAREERTVRAELPDGSVIVEMAFAGVDWLVREVLKEAGDAVVLAPADARAAVHRAAEAIAGSLGALVR
jgi:predicted DNA-binding transcriptional regulator YafY